MSENYHRSRLTHVAAALAKSLRQSREHQGLSQEEVASAVALSIDTYRNLERAQRGDCRANPTLDTLLRVAWVLKLDVLELNSSDTAGSEDDDGQDRDRADGLPTT